jgi:hypothetical protein
MTNSLSGIRCLDARSYSLSRSGRLVGSPLYPIASPVHASQPSGLAYISRALSWSFPIIWWTNRPRAVASTSRLPTVGQGHGQKFERCSACCGTPRRARVHCVGNVDPRIYRRILPAEGDSALRDKMVLSIPLRLPLRTPLGAAVAYGSMLGVTGEGTAGSLSPPKRRRAVSRRPVAGTCFATVANRNTGMLPYTASYLPGSTI